MEELKIAEIPAIIYGASQPEVFIYVHGKFGSKKDAAVFAEVAEKNAYQTLSFDLPKHGERQQEEKACDVWQVPEELQTIYQYASNRWENVNLVANSIGAYFSLLAFQEVHFEKVFFISPIVDMVSFIENLMSWFQVTEETLRQEKVILLPDKTLDPLDWEYYQYAKNHPIHHWQSATCIFYGENDEMQSREVIHEFAEKFDCKLTVLKNGSHALMSPVEKSALKNWFHCQFLTENK